MKKLLALVGWLAELAIIAGLLWKHVEFFLSPTQSPAPLVAFIIVPIIAFCHWGFKKRPYRARRWRLNLSLMSMTLSLFLISGLIFELRTAKILGGASKEMFVASRREGIRNEFFQQWYDDRIEKMKSDTGIYAILFSSSCLLFAARCSELSKISKLLKEQRCQSPP